MNGKVCLSGDGDLKAPPDVVVLEEGKEDARGEIFEGCFCSLWIDLGQARREMQGYWTMAHTCSRFSVK
jgi:hypothetical protein